MSSALHTARQRDADEARRAAGILSPWP